jgi:hypothetical protein
MMCRWNNQITSDCDQQSLNPSHPLSPPLPLLGLLPFLIPRPLSQSCCRIAQRHTGVFPNTSFDINYWH